MNSGISWSICDFEVFFLHEPEIHLFNPRSFHSVIENITRQCGKIGKYSNENTQWNYNPGCNVMKQCNILVLVFSIVWVNNFFLWGHTFITSAQNNQFLIPPSPPAPSIRKNEQYIYCLKITESANTWQISRFLPHFCLDVINVWSLITLHKKWSFPLRISCGFGDIYWRNT